MEKIVGMWSAGLEWCCCTLLARADDVAALCWVGLTLFRSAPVQGVSRPPHTASRDCRNGSSLARAIPCAPAPECGVTQKSKGRQNDAPKERTATRIPACAPTRSAASRAGMAGWAGEGGGRFGERREYEAPTLPSTPRQHGMARHHKSQERDSRSTAWLATTKARKETAEARHDSPPHLPAKKQHATTKARQESPRQPSKPRHDRCDPRSHHPIKAQRKPPNHVTMLSMNPPARAQSARQNACSLNPR